MTPGEPNDDRFLTRREAEILIANAAAIEDVRNAAHLREHRAEREAIEKALAAEVEQQHQHNDAHAKAHDAHEEKHRAESEAVKTALAAVDRERNIHAAAHDKEHIGHLAIHQLNNLAIDKAEAATDKRFASSNAYREQISELIQNLTSKDSFDGHTREMDRRLEDMRTAIVELQKYDVRGEGRTKGQGMVVAAIVGSVGFALTFLTLVVIVANFVSTGRP